MSNSQIATTQPKASALALMASRFNVDPKKLLETLKGTVFAAARSEEELIALVIVANEYKLNPLTKEIYAFPAKGGGIVPVISIDGWANLANSHPQMNGIDFEWEHSPDGKLISCTCVVHRKDRGHPVRVTEYLSECRRNTEPWKMEHRMLRHKALSQAVRIAFGFSGVYDEDEGKEVAGVRDVTPIPTASTSKLLFEAPAQPTKAEVSGAQLASIKLAHMMADDDVKDSQVLAFLADNGETFASLDEAPESVLLSVINNWDLVKGGGK